MKKVVLSLVLMASTLGLSDGFVVQFAQGVQGKSVTVLLDGRIEHTFAGKMGFRSATGSWLSVCANIRKPIVEGQYYSARIRDTAAVGGNVALAGNIVAKFFNRAHTPAQSAALQIAVWEALEYGDSAMGPNSGSFQVRADPEVLALAEEYYEGRKGPGHANFMEPIEAQDQIGPQPDLGKDDTIPK